MAVHVCRRISDLQGNGSGDPFPPLANLKKLKILWVRCFLINHHVLLFLLYMILKINVYVAGYWGVAILLGEYLTLLVNFPAWKPCQFLLSAFFKCLYIYLLFWTLLAFTLSCICVLGGDTLMFCSCLTTSSLAYLTIFLSNIYIWSSSNLKGRIWTFSCSQNS